MKFLVLAVILTAVAAIGCGGNANKGVEKPAAPQPKPTSKPVES